MISEVSYVLKDSDINMYLEKWVGRGKRIESNSFCWSLKVWSFKTECLKDNFIEHTLENFYSNSHDGHYSSSIISLCRYLVEIYEDEFIFAVGDSGLHFLVQYQQLKKNTNIMSDVDLNIYQWHILLRMLRNKLDAKTFEPEHLMKALNGVIILPKFSEYNNNNYEAESKHDPIIFWVRDIVIVFKKRDSNVTWF